MQRWWEFWYSTVGKQVPPEISDIQKKIIDVYSALKHVPAELVGSSSGSGILQSGDKVSTIMHTICISYSNMWQLGCACFPEFTQNFSEHQILWSLSLVDFHTLTLQLPIQTLHSVVPELQVFGEFTWKLPKFKKTSTPLS